LVILSYAQAQEFDKGHIAIQFGFTLSDYNDYNRVSSIVFPLYGTVEYAIHDYVSVGLMAHYFTKTYSKSGEEYNGSIPGYEYATHWKIRQNYLSIGPRAAFLVTPFLNEIANTSIPDKLHLLAGVQIGLDFLKSTKENEYKDYPDYSDTSAFGGPFIGCRYMFNKHIGAFAELGIGWVGHRNNTHFAATGLAFNF
jgi:hypothetical protein